MISGFLSIHPGVSLVYFAAVIFFSMIFKNPVYVITLVLVSIFLNLSLDSGKALKKNIKGYLIMATFIFLMNPIFSNRGETIIAYLGYRPITAESIVFGMVFACSLLSILINFCAFNIVITPNKFLYLTSSIMPKIAFIITVSMRFVPLFKFRLNEVIAVHKTLGKLSKSKSKKLYMYEIMETLNTVVTWSLEESLQTAASMRARGYGYSKRTSIVSYELDRRDYLLIFTFILSSFIVVIGFVGGYSQYNIYPKLTWFSWNLSDTFFYLGFFIFLISPILVDVKEILFWNATE